MLKLLKERYTRLIEEKNTMSPFTKASFLPTLSTEPKPATMNVVTKVKSLPSGSDENSQSCRAYGETFDLGFNSAGQILSGASFLWLLTFTIRELFRNVDLFKKEKKD
jgi:hypothetical protein